MAALRRDFLPCDLRPEMNAASVDGCIAVQARQTLEETRWLLDLADAYSYVSGVIGWVDLRAPDVAEQLDEFTDRPKFVGVRHVVQDEPDLRFMLQPEFCRGVGLLAERDLTYDLLIYPKQLPAAIELASRFPRQRFVLDHMAKPCIRRDGMREWSTGIRELAAHPHVFCKVSGLVTEADWTRWAPQDIEPYLDVVFDCFGCDRLLMGSDWPVCTLAADYGRVLALVDDYMSGRTARERLAVTGANAAGLWRLPGYADRTKGEFV
jgi:L-fuconolactonase